MSQEQKCRVCGCTEDNCESCIRATGEACHWVEPDLCSACDDAIKAKKATQAAPAGPVTTNFFTELAKITGSDSVDFNLRIMSDKNGKLVVGIMPGATTSAAPPHNAKGTPTELDEGFFNGFMKAAVEEAGLVITVGQVKQKEKPAAPAKETPDKVAPKKAGPKKAAKAAAPTKREKVVKSAPESPASMFDQVEETPAPAVQEDQPDIDPDNEAEDNDTDTQTD